MLCICVLFLLCDLTIDDFSWLKVLNENSPREKIRVVACACVRAEARVSDTERRTIGEIVSLVYRVFRK